MMRVAPRFPTGVVDLWLLMCAFSGIFKFAQRQKSLSLPP